jgi:hypothetical protein
MKTFQELFQEFLSTQDEERFELFSTDRENAEEYIGRFKVWLYTKNYALNVIDLMTFVK